MNAPNTRRLPARHVDRSVDRAVVRAEPVREPVIQGSQSALAAYYAGRPVEASWGMSPDGTPIMYVRLVSRQQVILQQQGPRRAPVRQLEQVRPVAGTPEYEARYRPRFSMLNRTLIAVAVVLAAIAAVIWALGKLFAAILFALPYVLGVVALIAIGSFLLSLIGGRGGGGGGGLGGGGGINIVQSIRIR